MVLAKHSKPRRAAIWNHTVGGPTRKFLDTQPIVEVIEGIDGWTSVHPVASAVGSVDRDVDIEVGVPHRWTAPTPVVPRIRFLDPDNHRDSRDDQWRRWRYADSVYTAAIQDDWANELRQFLEDPQHSRAPWAAGRAIEALRQLDLEPSTEQAHRENLDLEPDSRSDIAYWDGWLRFVTPHPAHDVVRAAMETMRWNANATSDVSEPPERCDAIVQVEVSLSGDWQVPWTTLDVRTGKPQLNLWMNGEGELPPDWESALRNFLRQCEDDLFERNRPALVAETTRSAAVDHGRTAVHHDVDARLPSAQRVFISYSRRDVEYVNLLVDHLKEAGITCWIDSSEIRYGSRWEHEIKLNLDACRAVVVVMSAASQESAWVSREVNYAMSRERVIFPLLLDGEVFFALNNIHFEDVVTGTMPSQKWLDQLRETLNRVEPSQADGETRS
ncbi:MAG TPA: toll/interleukin-1 receptor domain-containing protein [Ilumatobacteraceae bacterium]|nr:toll/interleukin-1 receptor domain-containing protein [Ilumatobacteraceae bacterium]